MFSIATNVAKPFRFVRIGMDNFNNVTIKNNNMAETRKLIKASRELKEEIARKLNVTTRTVEAALAYDTKSPTARLIRSYALNHGAKLYELKEMENPYKEVITL